ncbi:MAG: TRAP transporter substrate-binding protein DctP [Deltaproteobacteria bacterium]|nr:TRAP transporter substrate-binding protein DctP [Deltaproteobacteria bacterium]
MRRIICTMIALLGLGYFSSTVGTASAGKKPQYLIKFATVAPEGSTWVKQIRQVDKTLREKSGGRLGLRIYAGGIAGDELDVLKKMRIGQLQCAAFSGVGFGKILPMVRVLDLPYLFRNDQEVDKVHKALFNFFSEQFQKKGFALLAWTEVGNVNIFSKKAIHSLNDLAGLKIWAWAGDPIAKETFITMGVNPIPLAVTEVNTALNTGMIDTVYAPPLGALALQWHTGLSYMMGLPLVHSTGAILISSGYYKKLPEDLAVLLQKTMVKAMAELTQTLRQQREEAIKVIQDSGITVIPIPSEEARKPFYRIHEKVAQKLAGNIYPEELLLKVYKILDRPNS